MGELISKAGAIFAAIYASISCFAPLLSPILGDAAVAELAKLAIYRPFFIGLAGLALIHSLFTTFVAKYRKGTFHPRNYSFGKEEVILLVTTFLVFLAIFFPYISGACS